MKNRNTAPALLIPASSLHFLQLLKRNNNREWFNRHKDRFLKEQSSIEIFADALLTALNKHDVIETPSGKKSLHRIYRDTRFSNNKTPYKSNWSGSFTRAGNTRRGGYYFHIEPANSFIAGGFWAPNPADLKRIRDDIAFDAAPLRKIINSRQFAAFFGTLQGEQLKTAPRGVDAGNQAIDLLRYKQFLLIRKFTDASVQRANFITEATNTFRGMRPFFDYMSMVLSSGSNGVPMD
jgi:uncharacterized protein (TIGR02453 family)